jgi:hypothetical protein
VVGEPGNPAPDVDKVEPPHESPFTAWLLMVKVFLEWCRRTPWCAGTLGL